MYQITYIESHHSQMLRRMMLSIFSAVDDGAGQQE